MKPCIAISAALASAALASVTFATMTFGSVAAAEVVYHPFMVNPAYQVPMGPLTPFRPHRNVARYQPAPWTPVACEAVIFPRSPSCAGQPSRFSPYAEFPWNLRVYY